MIGIKNGVHTTEAPDFILFKKQQFCNIFVAVTTLQAHHFAIRCIKRHILEESPYCFAPLPPKSMLGMRVHGRRSSANIDFGGRGAGDASHPASLSAKLHMPESNPDGLYARMEQGCARLFRRGRLKVLLCDENTHILIDFSEIKSSASVW